MTAPTSANMGVGAPDVATLPIDGTAGVVETAEDLLAAEDIGAPHPRQPRPSRKVGIGIGVGALLAFLAALVLVGRLAMGSLTASEEQPLVASPSGDAGPEPPETP